MLNDLFIMLVEVLSHNSVTASELSAKLEVSVRTVYRYVDMLSACNIPIQCKRGRNGGIYICEEFKLRSNYFTREEFATMISALEALDSTHSVEVVRNTIDKLKSVTDVSDASSCIVSKNSIIIDNKGAADNIGVKRKISLIEKALRTDTPMRIAYHDRDGALTVRVVEPSNFVIQDGVWYIYAYCRLRDSARLFKINRITNIEFLDEKFTPKKLHKDWNLALTYDNDEERRVRLVLKVYPSARYDIEEWFGVENVKPSLEEDGAFIATGEAVYSRKLIYRLLSYGEGIRVLSPDGISKELRREIGKIANMYSAE